MVDWTRIDGTVIPSGTATTPGALAAQSGFLGVTGTWTSTLASFEPAISGAVAVSGTMAPTMGSFLMVAFESVPTSNIKTRLSLDAYPAKRAGSFINKGAAAGNRSVGLITRLSLDGYPAKRAKSFAGKGDQTGTWASTLDEFVSTASGTAGPSGTLASTLAAFEFSADGTVLVTGTWASTLDAFSFSGSDGGLGTWASTMGAFVFSLSGLSGATPRSTAQTVVTYEDSGKTECPVCGFFSDPREMLRRWDNILVHRKCWEPRHPSDLFNVKGETAVPDYVYADTTHAERILCDPTSIAGNAVAGCAINGM